MFYIGQRWYSEGEPELGLGTVVSNEEKLVTILFSLSDTERTYNKKNSPLKRFSLNIGDEYLDSDGVTHLVEAIEERNNRLFYLSKDNWQSEISIDPKIDLAGPMDRLFAGSSDSGAFFNLRYKAYLANRNYELFPHKGFLGAKMNLIPHQVYLADEILNSNNPKFMLCDEVGLGKTIEASIVIHSLIQQELIDSLIIIVPESLVNQWFVELFKKFSLAFKTISEETIEDLNLENSQRYIISSSLLKEKSRISEFLEKNEWDMVVLDESHQIPFHKEDIFLSKTIKSLVNKSNSSLFLSATPEVMGVENLFFQLQTLDPGRYTKLESFKDQNQNLQKLSSLIKDITQDTHDPKELLEFFSADELSNMPKDVIISNLVDRFGQGRSYFRNSRSNLEKTQNLFNQRVLSAYPIERPKTINDTVVIKEKVKIVTDVLEKIEDEKLLILCHSKDVVKKISSLLLNFANFKIAQFHSEQSLLERDRQAAYFADPAGAQILICTEVGSEGRNFEFAHNLVLFDIPKLPDQLEQRIGRLDRIGQKHNIQIHVPYIKESFEEVLFRWYNEVLGSFSHFPKGAFSFYQENKDALAAIIEKPDVSYDTQLNQLKDAYRVRREELEAGRDFLIEMRSFNEIKASQIIKRIKEFEQKEDCKKFLEEVCNAVGINFEQLNEFTYFIIPSDNMLLPSYPGLDSDGLSITFNRGYANRYPNIDYMSWEHPIVKGAFELLLNSPLGNMTLSQTGDLPRNIYFEFMIVARTKGPTRHESSKYFPYTPFRALLDIEEINHTTKISKKMLDTTHFEKMNEASSALTKSIPRDKLMGLKKAALLSVQIRIQKLKEKAKDEISQNINNEISRVKAFNISTDEKEAMLTELASKELSLISEVNEAEGVLDSIRVIFPLE